MCEIEAKLKAGRQVDKDILCFPALTDCYTGKHGLIRDGDHRGCRVLLGARVQTGGGSWGAHYSRYVRYECTCAEPFAGWSLLPEREFVTVLTFEQFAARKVA
jgi:hypothetical protein